MKNFLKSKLLPVAAGLFVAFVVMVVFEYINSPFFPLPEDFNKYDAEAARSFAATLPWTAYIMILFGWVIGSFKAGFVTTYLARERTYRLSFVVGIILTILAIINSLIIGHDWLFNLVGLPMFIVFTYLGHRYMRKFLEPGQVDIV